MYFCFTRTCLLFIYSVYFGIILSAPVGVGADSSTVEQLSYTQLVSGSNPDPPTLTGKEYAEQDGET